MATPNPTCPSYKKWRGVSNRNNQRVIEDAKPPVFKPKFNVYVPPELQDLLRAKPRTFKPEELEEAIAAIKASDKNQWLPAVNAVRKALSGSNPPIQQVVDLGAVPRLVYMMTLDDLPNLQLEAAWAACNVASGSSPQCKAVVDAGALPHAIRMLGSEDPALREQVAWLLGNVAGDGAVLRDACLDACLLSPLLRAIEAELEVKPVRQYVWLLLNITRFKPRQRSALLQALPTLAGRLSSSLFVDEEALADALSALAHIADECTLEVVTRAGEAVRRAGMLVNTPTTPKAVLQPAAKVLSALCSGDDKATQAVIDTQVLTGGYKRLVEEGASPGVMREVCFALSNIAAGNTAQAKAIVDAGLLPPLCAMYRRGDGGETVQAETTWVLSNLATKDTSLASAVLQGDVAAALAEHVAQNAAKSQRSEVAATAAAAEALLAILKSGDPGSEDNGPNPAVAVFKEKGVYDTLKSTLDRGLLQGKALTLVEKLLADFPCPE